MDERDKRHRTAWVEWATQANRDKAEDQAIEDAILDEVIRREAESPRVEDDPNNGDRGYFTRGTRPTR